MIKFFAEVFAILQALLILVAPTSLPLLFSYLTLALSSPPSFLLPQSLWQIWKELSSLSSCSIRQQEQKGVQRDNPIGHFLRVGTEIPFESQRRLQKLKSSRAQCFLQEGKTDRKKESVLLSVEEKQRGRA